MDPVVFAKRLSFAMEWQGRSVSQLVFSDEHVFSTNDGSVRTQWVRPGDPIYSRERRRAQNSHRLLVWGAIGFGVKCLVMLPLREGKKAFRLTSESYVKRCLAVALPLFQGRVLMQDGAKPHTATNTMSFLSSVSVEVLPRWPPNSPDLNPIEELWGVLNRRVAQFHPHTRDELELAVKMCWGGLRQEEVDAFCLTFAVKINECVRNEGEL
jgi:transposase